MIGLTSTLTRYMRQTRRNLDTRSRNRSRRPRARAAETGPREWQPFHLPFARGARELHLYLGDKFQHSASIPVDVTGEYPLSLRPIMDIEHRSARAEDQYEVVLPSKVLARYGSSRFEWSDGLGLVLEVDNHNHNDCVVVKEVRRGYYADLETDIKVGDEITCVQSLSVEVDSTDQEDGGSSGSASESEQVGVAVLPLPIELIPILPILSNTSNTSSVVSIGYHYQHV